MECFNIAIAKEMASCWLSMFLELKLLIKTFSFFFPLNRIFLIYYKNNTLLRVALLRFLKKEPSKEAFD